MITNRAMSDERLKECPFCGGEGNVSLNTCYGFVPWCSNEDCILNENTKGFSTEEEATKRWNTRKPMERIAERLQKELELADKEKERLAQENILQFDSAKGYATGIYNAIEIVKGGGVNE